MSISLSNEIIEPFFSDYGRTLPGEACRSSSFHILDSARSTVPRRIVRACGRVEISMFPNNALGGDTDMLSQLRSGALEFFTISPLVLSSLVSVAAINGLGFAFKDSDTAWSAMDGD